MDIITLVHKLRLSYPDITFQQGLLPSWSPQHKCVTYTKEEEDAIDTLLHEVGHALLSHDSYKSDIGLIKMEAAAWHKARELGATYGVPIGLEHVENALDTYRDWLHARSRCPACGRHGVQVAAQQYNCFNCYQTWSVSIERLCRPYRRSKVNKK